MQIPSLDNAANKLRWTLMSNPGTREFRPPRKPIRLRQQHHNSSGKRVTLTIPSNPSAFGFYENKSAATFLLHRRYVQNSTSFNRLQSACHHIFLKRPRACMSACLKCRFMYTKEIRLVEMLRAPLISKKILFFVFAHRATDIFT